MKNINVKGIDIVYDDSQEELLKSIIPIIENNYDLIFKGFVSSHKYFSLVSSDDPSAICSLDFFSDFYETIYQMFREIKDVDTPIFMAGLYSELLIREINIKNDILSSHASLISDEMLNALIAKKYYEMNGTFDEFVEYMKYREKDSTKRIRMWLRETYRYDTYNYILGELSGYLDKNGFDLFVHNLSDNMFDQMMRRKKNREEEKVNLPLMSTSEIDKVFCDFLDYINAPSSWKENYEYLKQNNFITYSINNSSSNSSMCHLDEEDNEYKILVDYDGSTTGFCSLVHEFVHYVSSSKNEDCLAISEFPSIFFERIAASFLSTKGYSKDVVEQTIKHRNKNNVEIFIDLSTLFSDVSRYRNMGNVSREDKYNYFIRSFELLLKAQEEIINRFKEEGKEIPKFNKIPSISEINDMVDAECDNLILLFLENNLLMIDGYQYLIGTYFTDCIFSSNSCDEAIPKVIAIVENISEFNTESIIQAFNIVVNEDKNVQKKVPFN